VHSDPGPLLLRKPGSEGIDHGTSGSLSKSSDHWTTEALYAVTNLRTEILIGDLLSVLTVRDHVPHKTA
jgi:hypothetical protein